MAGLEDTQEMDGSILKGFAGENAENTALDILHPQSPLATGYGVKMGLVDTGGVSPTHFLPKMALGPRKCGFRSPDNSKSNEAPEKKSTQATSSPASPLDWPGSPTQPFKKMKGGILEQIKEVRLMLAAEDKKMLAVESDPLPAETLEGYVA